MHTEADTLLHFIIVWKRRRVKKRVCSFLFPVGLNVTHASEHSVTSQDVVVYTSVVRRAADPQTMLPNANTSPCTRVV